MTADIGGISRNFERKVASEFGLESLDNPFELQIVGIGSRDGEMEFFGWQIVLAGRVCSRWLPQCQVIPAHVSRGHYESGETEGIFIFYRC